MKAALALTFLIAGTLLADEAEDRAAIAEIVLALGSARDAQTLEALLPRDLGRQERIWITAWEQALDVPHRPMSEAFHPLLTLDRLQFVTPDVAVADLQAWPVTPSPFTPRGNLILVLRKTGRRWRIELLRV